MAVDQILVAAGELEKLEAILVLGRTVRCSVREVRLQVLEL